MFIILSTRTVIFDVIQHQEIDNCTHSTTKYDISDRITRSDYIEGHLQITRLILGPQLENPVAFQRNSVAVFQPFPP